MKLLRILLTGANGFIGYHLCKKLLTLNHDVTALVYSDKSQQLKSLKNAEKLSIVSGDIRDSGFTSELFMKYPADVVFHLAIAPPSQSKPAKVIPFKESPCFHTNFIGTVNLLDSASKAGITTWVQSSTMSVYNFEQSDHLPVDEKHPANPKDDYGFSKLLAEKACQYYSNSDLRIIVLRYAGVFGPGKSSGLIAKFTKCCLENSKEIFSAAVNRTSDFIYVGDVVNANILAMNKLIHTVSGHPHEQSSQSNTSIYNIGSGEEITAYAAIEIIRDLCKNDLVAIDKAEGKSRRFYFDISKARNELGFDPRTIRQGLAEYITQTKKTFTKVN
jgi:UDP-glucose 4-epimerase